MIYLQHFICNGLLTNFDSMGIFLLSSHIRYHMKANDILRLLCEIKPCENQMGIGSDIIGSQVTYSAC